MWLWCWDVYHHLSFNKPFNVLLKNVESWNLWTLLFSYVLKSKINCILWWMWNCFFIVGYPCVFGLHVIMNTHLLAEIIFIFIIDIPRVCHVLANYSFCAAHNAISDVNVTCRLDKLFLTCGIIQHAERRAAAHLQFATLWVLYVACSYTTVTPSHI